MDRDEVEEKLGTRLKSSRLDWKSLVNMGFIYKLSKSQVWLVYFQALGMKANFDGAYKLFMQQIGFGQSDL